ncbi:MAG: lytic transglycosylase domain-containing protein [Chitinophagaceae bacterium]|nr:lytic transglycosylase domain-containing protein [Chitinophagaceae bacterium]
MKTTLWKQVVLLFVFTCALQSMQAKSPVRNNTPVLVSDSLAGINNVPVAVTIPLQSSVQSFVDSYLDEHADLLDNIKQRNGKTFTLIQKILVKRGVPAELLYLAVVESKLKNAATSGVGAAGIWQLMPSTARTLGLKVDAETDQRRHIYHSSIAAANYLNTLYKQFDDWLLVVAAYNCGAGNVQKAIKQSGSREFWKMQRYLPKETRDHVKRFIATHFHYEGEGSLATLTKTERTKYLASLLETNEEDDTSDQPSSTVLPVRWVLMTHEEGKLIAVLRK